MAVRITREISSGTTILRIDGRLRSEDVDTLTNEFQQIQGPVALELSELQSVDAAGADALSECAASGAELRGISAYVKLQLSQNGKN